MTPDEHEAIIIRHDLRPGDLGRVAELHGVLYAEEYGFDHRFEAYVAETIGEFGRAIRPEKDRLWLAERDGRLVGSIGIVGRDEGAAQLRWVLVHPDARGHGLGRRLMQTALTFCHQAEYRSVFLRTVSPLVAAARLYLSFGFHRTERGPTAQPWGVPLEEECYDLSLVGGRG